MASGDATAIPVKNQAYRVTFPILDADGDLVTGAAGLDSEVSKDGGTFADVTAEATEIATASGMYYLDLTSTEMNADTVAIIVKTTTSGAKTTPIVLYPAESTDIPVNLTAIGGVVQSLTDFKDMVDTGYDPTAHKIQSDLIYIHGTALTETDGQLAAGFKKLFDVATPLLVASDVMRGTDGANTTVPDAAGTLATYDPPTNTEMVAAFTEIKGATWAAGTDTLEHIRNKQTDIETDTAEIGTAGAGLTDLGGMSTGMKGEVQTEANDALVAQNLDHLMKIGVDTDWATTVHLDSVLGHLADVGTLATFDRTTDALEAIRNRGDAEWMTATGFNTVVPDAAGVAPTVTEIRQEMDSNSTKMAPSQTLNDYKATGFNTVVPDVAGTAAGLHTTTDGKIDALNDISVANIIAGITDGTLDLQEMMRIILAATAGKSSGGGTVTLVFRDSADSKDRITATVDATGNRTAMTLDGA